MGRNDPSTGDGLVPCRRSRRGCCGRGLTVRAAPHGIEAQAVERAAREEARAVAAQSVRILLYFRGSETRLEVSDDGCGLEPQEADQGGGLGLRGMRECAQGIGGTLRVESSPGKGTTVHVAVPNDQAAHR